MEKSKKIYINLEPLNPLLGNGNILPTGETKIKLLGHEGQHQHTYI